MSISALFFFLHSTLASVVVGSIFLRRDNSVAKYFGVGLLLQAVGFVSWVLAATMPSMMAIFATNGIVAVLVSLTAFLRAAIDNISSSLRILILAAGTLFVFAIFIVGSYVFPTPIAASSDSFFVFKIAPFVELMCVTIFLLTTVPLVEKISKLFRGSFSAFIKCTLSVQVVGVVILITSVDTLSVQVAGWVISLAYFALWTSLLFCKNAWN